MRTTDDAADFDPTGGERPYRVGTNVTRNDAEGYWRVEIVGAPDDVGAVLIPAEMMAKIVEDDTTDPARMAALIPVYKDEIEYEIAICAMEHFEPEMGIIPLGRSNQSQSEE